MLIKVENQLILSGRSDLINHLNHLIEEIETIVLDEHEQKMFKKELASLRKQKNETKQKIKQWEHELLEPVRRLEEELVDVQSLIDTLESKIDQKVKDFEESRRFNKYQELEAIFKKYRSSYSIEWVEFDQFIKNHHLNKTTSINKCIQDMISFFEQLKDDLIILETVQNKDRVFEVYKKSLSLGYSIKTIKDLDSPQQEPFIQEDSDRYFKVRLTPSQQHIVNDWKQKGIYFWEIDPNQFNY